MLKRWLKRKIQITKKWCILFILKRKVQHDDAKEVPSKHQNQENNQDQLKKILMTKKIVKNQILRKDVLAFFTEKVK